MVCVEILSFVMVCVELLSFVMVCVEILSFVTVCVEILSFVAQDSHKQGKSGENLNKIAGLEKSGN